MTLSRTARILLALLLLAAAAFFWVNFFTQNRVIGEDPDAPTPSTAEVPPTAPAPTDAEVETEADAEADVDPEAIEPSVADPDAVAPDEADADAPVVAAPVDDGAPVVTDPPVVVVDPPVTLARDVVIADLPFLITDPPAAPDPEAPDAPDDAAAERALAAARATVNPFSPVVRPPPPAPDLVATAPERDVPATPGVTEVTVPAAPPAPPARVATPAPRPLAPAPTIVPSVDAALARSLPSGTPLAATPALLRETRAIDTIDRATVPEITTLRVPTEIVAAPIEAGRLAPDVPADVPEMLGTDISVERATVPEITTVRVPAEVVAAPIEEGRLAANVPADVPEMLGTDATVTADAPTGAAPLAAGTNRLARFLRDNGYSFTGSVLGPVSVGVFRSNGDPVPQVVALGQTLPNTEIVLTDLRGQQAELMLDDIRQILILDIRR